MEKNKVMQLGLFSDIEITAKFPSTRYQGSKLKYIDWIWHCIKDIPFNTMLDAFGGTGSVAYRMKQEGKSVTYNDILKFNSIIGKALIENESHILEKHEIEYILKRHADIVYPDFIEKTFPDTYFTDNENRWLDVVATNIQNIKDEYKQSIAWFSLFQSCIIKRPYNLFHRKNLYIRTQEVKRSFGNKVTWDTPFEVHFRNFAEEANNSVFSNGQINTALNKNIFDIKNNFDLVYIDTPYVSEKGVGVDYRDFYHFLEGISDYNHWGNKIDYNSKHKRLQVVGSDWTNAKAIENAFDKLISRFRDSVLVISYRSDGIPTIERISDILTSYGKKVVIHESREMKYVLSTKQSTEVLIIGQ